MTDRFGQSASSSTNLNVVQGPVAFAQADPGRTGCEQVVTFDGRGSSSVGPAEQGFDIVSYEWDLNGDGETDFDNPIFEVPVTAQPTGNPPRVILNARLTVTNAIGEALIALGEDPGPHQSIDDIEVIIDVQNLPPVANAAAPSHRGQQRELRACDRRRSWFDRPERAQTRSCIGGTRTVTSSTAVKTTTAR